VYGLIGACWTLALTDRKDLDPFIAFALPIVLFVQMSGDLLMYVFFYTPRTGYCSHFFGFTTGLLFSLSLKLFNRRSSHLLRAAALTALVLLCTQCGYLLYAYSRSGAPNVYTANFIHNSAQTQGCCAALFDYASTNQMSIGAAQNETYCSHDVLYYTNK
jgi:cyanate permease